MTDLTIFVCLWSLATNLFLMRHYYCYRQNVTLRFGSRSGSLPLVQRSDSPKILQAV